MTEAKILCYNEINGLPAAENRRAAGPIPFSNPRTIISFSYPHFIRFCKRFFVHRDGIVSGKKKIL